MSTVTSEQALDALRQIQDPDLFKDIGWTYYLMSRHREARDTYERGLELNPDNDDLVVELARVHFWLREYDRSEELYQSILDRNADHPHALWGLGDVYRVQGRRSDAIPLVERALAIAPDHPYARQTLRILRAGG